MVDAREDGAAAAAAAIDAVVAVVANVFLELV